MSEPIRCRGCGGFLDDMGSYGFCSLPDCRLRCEGYKLAFKRINQDPAILQATLNMLIRQGDIPIPLWAQPVE
jgi:hypothetical protein